MRNFKSRLVGTLVVIGLLAIATFTYFAGTVSTCATNVVVSGTTKLLESFDKTQLGFLSLANNIGLRRKLSEQDRATALAVMIQESRAKNLDYGDRDSLGLFQQRPSVKAWGTAEQIMDPNHAINAFYDALEKVNNRARQSPLDLALKVQRPSKAAYLSDDNYFPGWVDDAYTFIRRSVSGTSGSTTVTTSTEAQTDAASRCSVDGLVGLSPVLLGSGKLRYPTKDTEIDSKFGMRFHPIYHYWKMHDGADFSNVSIGDPIYAAASGVITKAFYNGGKGNYIEIDHGGGLATGYAHQSRFVPGIQPGVRVSAGQVIGYIGTTGTSTGPHLHFCVFKNGTAVNPAPYLKG